jgi:hypothetical protein
MADFVAYPIAFIPCNALRRIDLDLINRRYFRFLGLASSFHIGLEDNTGYTAAGCAAISRLRELPSLFHPNFHFNVRRPAQSRDGRTFWSDDPWRIVQNRNGTKKVSCQKIFVD